MRKSLLFVLLGIAVLAVAIVIGLMDRHGDGLGLAMSSKLHAKGTESSSIPLMEPTVLKLSAQARKNLRLTSRPAIPQTYWRKLQIPGAIVDRPGKSDRGITAPAVGAVVQIHSFPGDTIKAGDPLFTLRLFSEYLQNTQSELFKATRETLLLKEQKVRLEDLAKDGTILGAKLIELDNQMRRLAAAIQAFRQDLLTRGLSPEQIDSISEGQFVSTITVVAPPQLFEEHRPHGTSQPQEQLVDNQNDGVAFEVQELKVDLGQQVQAGQLLAMLSNHHSLYIEGHAFKQEAPFLEQAAQRGWQVDVEFAEDDSQHWPPLDQEFRIRHLANTIDTVSRTFDFFIPLTNQSRGYEKEGKTFVVWRFRPGQRVRLHVPVEEMTNVIVLPSAAVVREGPEAFVFQQNGDLFNRVTVQILYEDRLHAVLAPDGKLTSDVFLAQSSAASLNRILKAQGPREEHSGVHVHADGTVHGAH